MVRKPFWFEIQYKFSSFWPETMNVSLFWISALEYIRESLSITIISISDLVCDQTTISSEFRKAQHD